MQSFNNPTEIDQGSVVGLSDFNTKEVNYFDTGTLVKINQNDKVYRVVGKLKFGLIKVSSSTEDKENLDELQKSPSELEVVREIPVLNRIVLLMPKQSDLKNFDLIKLAKEYDSLDPQKICYENFWAKERSTLGKFAGESRGISFYIR